MKQKGTLSRTTAETKQKVINLYQKGLSQNHIEKALFMTRKTIRKILEEAEIKRTKFDQSYFYHVSSTLREDAFDVVSDEMAYWLGFLYADGYVTNPKTRFSVGLLLKESDLLHIEKLKDFLKAPQTIYHDVANKTVKLLIGSQRLHATLLRWGFTHNKSYDAAPPEVMRYNRHFWRGVVDGDGYLGTIAGYPRLQLCGTEEMVSGFKRFLDLSGVDSDSVVRKAPNKSLYIYELSSTLAVGASKILYENCSLYLDRKFDVYNTFLTTKFNQQ